MGMSNTTGSLKIFISYARQDARELALRLHQDLRAVGYETWLDLSEIPGGASWSQDIENAIESCDIALALLSSGSYVSEICRAEQLRALRKGKRVIPALVQPDAERPLVLEHLNYLDFTDASRYESMFRDLLSDITAGQAFRLPSASVVKTAAVVRTASPFRQPKGAATPYAADEKRDARAFRRYIADLREESWLGARYWWPYFLFHFSDMQTVADTLKDGALLSPAARATFAERRFSAEQSSAWESAEKSRLGDSMTPHRRLKRNRWDNTVRLYFRPRTPDLFSSEGPRPVERQRPNTYCPLPVYLLFDLEAVICQSEARFSDGDVTDTGKTSKAATAFRDLPFDLIYHDSWFQSDEKDEVMRHRRAQVIVPDKLALESLQYIWCRSPAEYETLRHLLPADVWATWRDKITARMEFNLFNRKWAYVEEAMLSPTQARLRFNPCESRLDCGPFAARAEVIANGATHRWQQENFVVDEDFTVDLSEMATATAPQSYSLRLYLNDDLAYAGSYAPDDGVF
jgi:hypothetical protein